MLYYRRAKERGHADLGWLKSDHSFSFGDYQDPLHMNWGVLRVINEDLIQPGTGFGSHGHRDMEILTYLLVGELQHKDSMGHGTVIHAGDVQRMSAGKGVIHSEFNPSESESTHLLQIWIEPNRHGTSPSYEQVHFTDADKRSRLCLIASPDGADGSVRLQQDAYVFAGLFEAGEICTHSFAPHPLGYIHVARGSITVDAHTLGAGDAIKVENQSIIRLAGAHEGGEVLVFNLPPATADK